MFGSSGSPAMYSVDNITLVEEQTNVVNHKYLQFPVGFALMYSTSLKGFTGRPVGIRS